MGSKSKGKSYTSKGIVGHPMRTRATGAEKILNKVRAWKAGKNVKIQIPREYDKKGKMVGSGAEKEYANDLWGPYKKKPKVEKDLDNDS